MRELTGDSGSGFEALLIGVACFVLWREISRYAFWDFCNTIPPITDINDRPWHVRKVLGTEVAVSFDHLVGALLDGQAQHQ